MAEYLIDYLPQRFADVYEIKSMFSALQDEVFDIKTLMQKNKENMFITSCDDEMTKKYCDFFNVSSSEDLKTMLMLKLSSIPPFSIDTLHKYLTLYLPEYNIIVNENLTIDINYRTGGVEIEPSVVIDKLYELIPANLAINFVYMYLTYGDLKAYTWRSVADKTWRQLIY